LRQPLHFLPLANSMVIIPPPPPPPLSYPCQALNNFSIFRRFLNPYQHARTSCQCPLTITSCLINDLLSNPPNPPDESSPLFRFIPSVFFCEAMVPIHDPSPTAPTPLGSYRSSLFSSLLQPRSKAIWPFPWPGIPTLFYLHPGLSPPVRFPTPSP